MFESTKIDKAVFCKSVKCFKQRVRHKQAFVSTSGDTNTQLKLNLSINHKPINTKIFTFQIWLWLHLLKLIKKV